MLWPGWSELGPQVAFSEELSLSKSRGRVQLFSRGDEVCGRNAWLPSGLVWGENPQTAPLRISTSVDWPFEQRPTIYQLMRYSFRAFATGGIAHWVSSMVLTMNELTIVDSSIPAPGVYQATAQPEWPRGAPKKFTGIQWEALAISEAHRIGQAIRPYPPVAAQLAPKL